jgi:hypothetical protein
VGNPVRSGESSPFAAAEGRAVILVEGMSDAIALETLARRRGRALAEEGVSIIPMGGATNLGQHLTRYGPAGLGLRIAGLYDAGAGRYVRRAMEHAGYGRFSSPPELERSGFFSCHRDLEDELIRALGTNAVVRLIESQGELPSLRILQQQPAQRERGVHDQLHRFMGTRSGRKHRYAGVMAGAIDLMHVPRALDAVLDAV